jgi:4-hydroxybenzoate polyprenyltransferase
MTLTTKRNKKSVAKQNLPNILAANATKLLQLTALRPRQWTKNLVVFAAPLFAFSINVQSLLGSLLAFTLFCCASSGFYLMTSPI